VILEGTLRKERGLRSVVNKLLIQICAKIGGEPWVFKDIPCSKEPTMLLAFTTYKNILTCCGTYNKAFTQYFSNSTLLDEHNQAGTKVEEIMKSMIMQFNSKWRCFPRKLIVFREGVQSNMVEQFYSEIKSIKKVIKDMNMAVEPKLSYVVMNKKHNLKTVLVNNNNNKYFNIPSGTLIDDVVVGDDYEFYLVSQSSNQGISQAMHYKIIFDEIELKPEDVHLLVYKMCFLYYNWTGGIKTPAPAHYAKKLAYLVGDKLSSKGHVELPNQKIEGLYFL
jgi:aubergine-like protein